MSFRNDRMNHGMASLDNLSEKRDFAKLPALSDRGESVARMTEALDWSERAETAAVTDRIGQRNASIVGAVLRLTLAELDHLTPVLLLILCNGKHRELSMLEVKKTTYFTGRNALLHFFAELECTIYLEGRCVLRDGTVSGSARPPEAARSCKTTT